MILSPCASSRRSAPGCGTQLVSCPSHRYRYGATGIRAGPRSVRPRGVAPVREIFHARIALSSSTFFSCMPPAAIMMFGAPRGGSCLAVEIGVVEEVDVVDHEALLARGSPLEHRAALDDAHVLLDHLVARTGGNVVSSGHTAGAGSPERANEEFVAVVRAQRIVAGAQRVTHRIRTFFLLVHLLCTLSEHFVHSDAPLN